MQTIGAIVGGTVCALACLYSARLLLKRLNLHYRRLLAKKVRMHLHRKRVLRQREPTDPDSGRRDRPPARGNATAG